MNFRVPLLLVALGISPIFADEPGQTDELRVAMSAHDGVRPAANFFARAIGQTEKLVLRGEIEVDGKSYVLYLPRPGLGYSIENTATGGVFHNSTAIGIDHDGDGKISPSENFLAHLEMRIGPAMFRVTHIAEDGAEIRLRRTATPPTMLARGALADSLTLTTTDGKTTRVADLRGQALLLKFWSPT